MTSGCPNPTFLTSISKSTQKKSPRRRILRSTFWDLRRKMQKKKQLARRCWKRDVRRRNHLRRSVRGPASTWNRHADAARRQLLLRGMDTSLRCLCCCLCCCFVFCCFLVVLLLCFCLCCHVAACAVAFIAVLVFCFFLLLFLSFVVLLLLFCLCCQSLRCLCSGRRFRELFDFVGDFSVYVQGICR